MHRIYKLYTGWSFANIKTIDNCDENALRASNVSDFALPGGFTKCILFQLFAAFQCWEILKQLLEFSTASSCSWSHNKVTCTVCTVCNFPRAWFDHEWNDSYMKWFAKNAEWSVRNAERSAGNSKRFARSGLHITVNIWNNKQFAKNKIECFGGVVACFRVCRSCDWLDMC